MDLATKQETDTFDIESVLPPFAYGTFGGTFGQMNMNSGTGGGENYSQSNMNPFNSSNSNLNLLSSPSYSHNRTTPIIGATKKAEEIEKPVSFQAITKCTTWFLTLECFILLANQIQMIALYNILADNDRKSMLIYWVFPFICFISLKLNDVNLCNEVEKLYTARYTTMGNIVNKYRQIIHQLTFLGFPCLWFLNSMVFSSWIFNNEYFKDAGLDSGVLNTMLITLWLVMQFIQFVLCVVVLLYCIQHNIGHRLPDKVSYAKRSMKYSFSLSNAYHYNNQNNEQLIKKISMMERQNRILSAELLKSKHEMMTNTSIMSNDLNDELQHKNQEYRALVEEQKLLKQESESKRSLLNLKKAQCKTQQQTIKSLQTIREENVNTINDLKSKLKISNKEISKLQLLLQIERQNVKSAQEYFEHFN